MMKRMDKLSFPNTLPQQEKREHPYGIIWESSACNILEDSSKGSLIIAPFHDHRYTYNILIWNPQSLRILNRFPADRIWKLWDNYYVTFQKDLTYVDNLLLHSLTSKGMKKIKNINLNTDYSFTKVQRIIGSKKFKIAYVMEDFWIGVIWMNSTDREEWASEEEILQAFVSDSLNLLTICTWGKIMLHPLDEKGMMSDDKAYEILLENDFGAAYMNGDELTVISTKEDREKNLTNVHVSHFKLNETEYEEIQKEKFLVSVPLAEYDFEFLSGNKVIVCVSDHEPLTIVSIETGEVLFKNQIIGKLLKIDPDKSSMFLSSYTGLQKLSLDIEIPK